MDKLMTIMMRENIILKKKTKNQTISYENSISNSILSKLHNIICFTHPNYI